VATCVRQFVPPRAAWRGYSDRLLATRRVSERRAVRLPASVHPPGVRPGGSAAVELAVDHFLTFGEHANMSACASIVPAATVTGGFLGAVNSTVPREGEYIGFSGLESGESTHRSGTAPFGIESRRLNLVAFITRIWVHLSGHKSIFIIKIGDIYHLNRVNLVRTFDHFFLFVDLIVADPSWSFHFFGPPSSYKSPMPVVQSYLVFLRAAKCFVFTISEIVKLGG